MIEDEQLATMTIRNSVGDGYLNPVLVDAIATALRAQRETLVIIYLTQRCAGLIILLTALAALVFVGGVVVVSVCTLVATVKAAVR